MLIACCSVLNSQEIKINSNTSTTAASSGWYPWYEIHADPENRNNIIVCGARWVAKDNAQYGFVYFSSDGGKNWHSTLEDKHSTWVSEESCAFGVHGVAYYVADASKVDEAGNLHHDLGTTYVYSSQDGGRTWKEPIKTGWTDYSSSVVDTSPGPNQNRLYVSFNNLETFYHSLGDQKALDSLPKGGNTVGLISYKDGDAKVDGPVFNSDMAASNYRGSYPAPSFVLKDGTLLTFFSSHLNLDPKDREKREFLIASIRSNPDRTALENPVNVVTDTPKPDESEKCGFGLTSAGAYDPVKDIIYFAYPLGDEKSCHLMLISSTDGGKTWKPAQRIHLPDENSDSTYESPALAVNKEGVLGLMWTDGRTGCWNFAASTSGDRYFNVSKRLNDCSSPAKDVQAITDAYLWSVLFQPSPKNADGENRVAIRNMKNADWRNNHAIAVTPDGVFHPVWIDAGDGRGEIRTAAVTVTSVQQLAATQISGLTPVSNKVAVLYGGTQHYDDKSGTLTLAVTFRNNSGSAVKAPFKLEAMSVDSDYLNVEVANAANHAIGGGAVWDVTSSVPGGVLAPGATSQPYTLTFHTTPKDHFTLGDVLSLNTKLYARP
uniref:Exo-alpha-sialidase n=1 Tax=Paracidobacterium acidisoli TaxID=2303751 RepID=A0A372IN67_9BACT